MKASRSAIGSSDAVSAEVAGRLGPAELAADLVAGLLVERRRGTSRSRAPCGEGHDRADVLALEVEGPALVHLAGAERGGEGLRGRVAAAQAAQVDDVPRRRVAGVDVGLRAREVAGDGVGDGGQIAPARRGSSRSRRGTRRRRRRPSPSAGRASASVASPWRIVVVLGVARLDLVAMHERDDRDRVVGRRRPRPAARRPASGRGRCRRRRPTTPAGRPSC